ncbi:DNA helicase RecD, partial [Streptomyces sp. G35A]
MSTEPPETAEDAAPGTQGEGAAEAPAEDAQASESDQASEGPQASESDQASEGPQASESDQASEAEAELQAQRLERERIERRKAEKQGPIEAGGKLSGRAADLLA